MYVRSYRTYIALTNFCLGQLCVKHNAMYCHCSSPTSCDCQRNMSMPSDLAGAVTFMKARHFEHLRP
jgi:hypothetical protein